MRAVVQRVSSGSVEVEGTIVGRIENGLVVLLGITYADTGAEADYLAEKIVNLRIFEDTAGKMNRSLIETGGAMLIISQFTLYGDCRKGRRPSFVAAARPEQAIPLYEQFIDSVRKKGVVVECGEFGAHMKVSLVNDGPVTLIVES